MDQVKIGKFIAQRRKQASLTQMQLAEKLGITDRAVSKWETGKALPDSSIMLELCDVLGITVNDLLCGEVVTMENYNKEMEQHLLDMIKQKEEADRRLLRMEIVLGIIALLPLLAALLFVGFTRNPEGKDAIVVLVSLIPLLIATPFALKIEQKAGYYVCQHCANTYVPKYISVFLAPHMGTTRYMKCPKCHRRSWNKKRISKD